MTVLSLCGHCSLRLRKGVVRNKTHMTSFFAQSGHRERTPIHKSVKPVLLMTLCTERKEAYRGVIQECIIYSVSVSLYSVSASLIRAFLSL